MFTKHDSKIHLKSKEDYEEVLSILYPINIFTHAVEANYCSISDAYEELLTLKYISKTR